MSVFQILKLLNCNCAKLSDFEHNKTCSGGRFSWTQCSLMGIFPTFRDHYFIFCYSMVHAQLVTMYYDVFSAQVKSDVANILYLFTHSLLQQPQHEKCIGYTGRYICIILSQVRAFWSTKWQKIALSHSLPVSPLQQCYTGTLWLVFKFWPISGYWLRYDSLHYVYMRPKADE